MGTEILEQLKRAVIEYDSDGAASLAKKAVDEKVDALEVMSALTEAIRQVGDGFAEGKLWLPELVAAANAMQVATPILEEEIRKTGAKRETLGSAVVGTVFGDIHSIGKAMVCTLLTAEGFEVHDLGVNVKVEDFVAAVKNYEPDILAMSALLTSTALLQRRVITALKEAGIRDKVKIMVGGAAITEEFAGKIGADGYDPTAPGAARLARVLVGK